ncbi:hypothetical protein PMI14_04422 [Acidovorax sp. CF316]|nr:hypothetical protein PMI14_04422 [Acidovorax sp. CF316]
MVDALSHSVGYIASKLGVNPLKSYEKLLLSLGASEAGLDDSLCNGRQT